MGSLAIPVSALNRPERIADIDVSGINRSLTLPTNGGLLPPDRFMYGLGLMFEGRITNAGAGNPTAVLADAPFSLFESIEVEGYHRIRAAREQFINIRGADLRELNRAYLNHTPISTPATLATGAAATNDIRFYMELPFVPYNMPARQWEGFLLDAPNYDVLKLTIRFSDDASVFTRATAGTFSAFGSATGNPRIRVVGMFAQQGPQQFRGFVPARVWRSFREVTSGDIVNGATQSRLFDIPRGHRIRSILLKTGVRATVTAGNNAYLTLSDTILTNLDVFRGINRVNRNYFSMFDLKENTGMRYGLNPNTGYGLIDWAPNGVDMEVLDTRGLVAGPTGDVDVFIRADIAGAVSQGAVAVFEEWRQAPVIAVR
jgi:hypothetical protein